ncbi:piggyBac transposable element-derived protein 4-like [Lytechinus variegatus]|uniref:piggyBac transposable element-derived protein 4-like n=1 Tax=Lytechinus variegatus TaxID=7654 RepID=UPI001BB15E92|nr:piggyBac transposable element-derived protein 4-like [Lytechinus variegatus]
MAACSDISSSSLSEDSSSVLSDDNSRNFSQSDDEFMDISSSDEQEGDAVLDPPQAPSNLRRPRGVRVRGGGVRGRMVRTRGGGTPPVRGRGGRATVNYRTGWQEVEVFQPADTPFTGSPGPTADYSGLTPVEIFFLFFTAEVWDLIVEETNRYASQTMAGWTDAKRDAYRWTDVDRPTMQAFIALIMAMGVVGIPRYKLYWSTMEPFVNPFFPSVMARNTFTRILRFLHLNNNQHPDPTNSRTRKVDPFIKIVIPLFQTRYMPAKNISPDESMIRFKGRLSFVQYMPLKPIKWGMKAWALCESSTGYTWSWALYTGGDGNRAAGPFAVGAVIDGSRTHPGEEHIYSSGKVVLELVKGLENKGHHLYCDNFYTSPALFAKLQQLGFEACGTVRASAKGLPDDVNQKKRKTKKGDPPMFLTKRGQLCIAWHDKKPVVMLSTNGNCDMIEKRVRTRHAPGGTKVVRKPATIEAYNQNMGGVDKADQFFQYYIHAHRTVKWWKKVFFHIIEMSLHNAYIIHHACNPDSKLDSLGFRLKVIHGLLENWPRNRTHMRRRAQGPDQPERLTGRHFPKKVEGDSRPDCIVCSNRSVRGGRKQTRDMCRDCDRPMCAVPCFERYHTLLNYRPAP